MKTLKQKIKIMQACLDGEDIQLKGKTLEDWTDTTLTEPAVEMSFNWGMTDYRIKPKPMEAWITKRGNRLGNVYRSLEDAEYGLDNEWKAVKFIEIIE